MNFFEQQDRAKRNTNYLLFLLALAVISLVIVTTLLVAFVVFFAQSNSEKATSALSNGWWQSLAHSLSLDAMLWIALGITSVVFIGSAFRYLQLQSGGRSVAESVGGRLLQSNTQDLDERKILNVVEEMAIASGTAVPPVYLLEEDAINAFAAGYSPQDAVIGITRGCIRQLNRDELQGVVAHEFSHIFHGDMRINMRLIALLYGILAIGLVGQLLLRNASHLRLSRSSRDKSTGLILALGVGLLVIGYTGTFFGNLIKAAVSRQREFLADASAVKFTRNPDGIAGALKKIGGVSNSELYSNQAAEFSHMYFSQGVKLAFTMMATHPPLTERIKRIQPYWNGKISTDDTRHISTNESLAKGFTTQETTDKSSSASALIDHSIAHIADPAHSHLDYARQRLADISAELRAATQEPFGARAVVLGLLLDLDSAQSAIQTSQLTAYLKQTGASHTEIETLINIMRLAANSSPELKLPLIELSMTALKQLTHKQRQDFLGGLEVLISADQKISLFEWSLYRIVRHNLKPPQQYKQHMALRDLPQECRLVLSIIVYAGSLKDQDATNVFTQATEYLSFSSMTLLPKNTLKLENLDKALAQLNLVKPLQKPLLLKAMSQCIIHDGKINHIEAELFRALADSLDCPLPPLSIP